MSHIARDETLARIRSNIERFGHHVHLITGARAPRFAYTIGLSPSSGAELILAGATFYSVEEVKRILDSLVARGAVNLLPGATVNIDSLGAFALRSVHQSWAIELILGAVDYYQSEGVAGLQVVPDSDHWTIDVPDLSRPRSAEHEPVWRWLAELWPFTVSDRSLAATNLGALRGEYVTEVMRWEEEYWEMFAGAAANTPEKEARIVPLGTLLGADLTLAPVTELEKGKGLRRGSGDLAWQGWSLSS